MLSLIPTPAIFISHLFVLFTSFSVHEFAHAWTANYFGDDTPRLNGRLTLNPLRHLDPIGSILLLVAGFGWAKPVPVNPYALQRRSASAYMWVSIAGPVSNLLMAIVAAIPFRLGFASLMYANQTIDLFGKPILPSLSMLLYVFIWTNLLLMLFNLIPVSPLDGEKVVEYFAPPSFKDVMDKIRPYGPLILILLVVTNGLEYVIYPPLIYLTTLLVR
jgi:Zn-dependent protease